MDSLTKDDIARKAAGLFVAGKAATVAQAIRVVMGTAEAHDAPAPSPGRVRQHIRGMTMQALGEAAYKQSIQAVWEAAEMLMTMLEESSLDIRTAIVGRAARGEMDGDFRVHIRLFTRASVSEIADLLEVNGYGPLSIETINTRHGRLNRLTFEELDHEIVLTRCPPDMKIPADRDVMEGRKIDSLTLEELRRRIAGT